MRSLGCRRWWFHISFHGVFGIHFRLFFLILRLLELSGFGFPQDILDILAASMDAMIELFIMISWESRATGHSFPRTLYSSTASSQLCTSAESSQISSCVSGLVAFLFFPMACTVT